VTGDFGAEIVPDVTVPTGVVVIASDMFHTAWGTDSDHTVELFSLTNQTFNFDRVQVYDSTGTLPPGYYEEFAPGLQYFDDDAPTYTLGASSFVSITDIRASTGKVMATEQVGEGMLFQFHGTGFSVLFTQDRFADAVKICWQRGTTTDVDAVLTGGTCRTYDNESLRLVNKAGRTILGLDEADYTVIVQMLDDNNDPDAHIPIRETPLTLKIDAVQTYNEAWFTAGDWDDVTNLDKLTPGMRYETSYENREEDNRFQYFGDVWTSVSGVRARLYSGQDYDRILRNGMGSGVVFRTDQADGLILYRDTRYGSAPIEICVAPMNVGETQVDLANRICTMIANDGGVGYQQPQGLLLTPQAIPGHMS
jgi:hypothetical protein